MAHIRSPLHGSAGGAGSGGGAGGGSAAVAGALIWGDRRTGARDLGAAFTFGLGASGLTLAECTGSRGGEAVSGLAGGSASRVIAVLAVASAGGAVTAGGAGAGRARDSKTPTAVASAAAPSTRSKAVALSKRRGVDRPCAAAGGAGQGVTGLPNG
jgi:hypothetical protein